MQLLELPRVVSAVAALLIVGRPESLDLQTRVSVLVSSMVKLLAVPENETSSDMLMEILFLLARIGTMVRPCTCAVNLLILSADAILAMSTVNLVLPM